MKVLNYTFLLLLLMPSCMMSGQTGNKIIKAFHHEGAVADRLVFYFSNQPVCNYIPHKDTQIKEGHVPINQDGTTELEFFLPLTTIAKGETARFIEKLGALDNDLYRVKVEVDATRNGLRCFVLFRPEEVGFQQESFQAITGDPALAFSFFKRSSLHKVVNNSRPIRQTAQLKKKVRVAIDCGHGDKDPGFVVHGVKEKDINLSVGLKTARLLEDNGYDVFLTRDSDEFLRLDARTTETNRQADIDLFVSIHTNASKHKNVSGVETFCMHPTLLKHEFGVVNKKLNKAIQKHQHDLCDQSKKLAHAIQKNVLTAAKDHNNAIVDRKVRHKTIQVLMGTEVPSVLIELGFLSHEKERCLLQSEAYQDSLAQGLFKGISTFLS